jgi:hypothetical protein
MIHDYCFILLVTFLLDLLLATDKQHIIFHVEDVILSHAKVHVETATYLFEMLEYTVGTE